MDESGRAGVGIEDEAQRGREAALLLLDAEEHPGPIEGFSQEFAEAALDEIERLQKTRFKGLAKRILDGFHRALKAKNPDPAHGLTEVFQNANDQGATELRLALRRRTLGNQLLIVHNGEPMRLDHVIGLVFPGITSKLDDAEALGRYGIGLKILYRLGGPLVAHCPPFHFQVEAAGLHRTAPEPAIPGFYDPDRHETLLVLDLDKRYGKPFFVHWLGQWDASSLVFLRALRSIKLVDLASGRALVEHTLKQTSQSELKLNLRGKRVPAERVVLRDAGGSRSWTRYRVTIPTVKGIERAGDKETGKTTTIAVAVPARPSRGRLHVGFRLDEPCSLPFSLDAQFDPDDSRSRLLENEWNAWLLAELGELVSAVMLERFGNDPARGWGCVPRSSEHLGEDDSWLRSQGAPIGEQPRAACLERVRLDGRRRLALNDLVYESGELDKLLREDELEALAPSHAALRAEWRDGAGRWREVMDDLAVGETVDAEWLLMVLDEPVFESRDPEWFVQIADAGLESSYLDSAPWIVTSDGRRHSPDRVRSESVLIMKTEADGLAAKLRIANRIDAAFLASNEAARRVEKWLGEEGLLVSKLPTQTATLAALAARDSEEEPISLEGDDTLLREIRDALDELRHRGELSDSELDELGRQIGANITVDGREWRNGKRVKIAVRPSEAYLPRSIDSTEDGFPAAADRTPGLKWIDPRYSALLRGDDGPPAPQARKPKQKALGGTPRISGARAFFFALSAEVSPRLRQRTADTFRYSESAVTIPTPLSVEHEEAVAGLHHPHLVADWDSPDLDAVIADIAKAKKADRQRRAKSLLATIARRPNWIRLYEDHVWASVISFPYTGRPWWTSEKIRTTWAARAASVAWMSSESGLAKPPRDLALRTDAFIALHDEQPDLFASGLDETDADSPVLEAFAIEGRPQASTIMERLEDLRDKELAGAEIDLTQVSRCYAALARYCPGGPDERRSNRTPRQLQARFRSGPGLVRSQSGWRPPREVFRGQDIFGGRRPHIPTAGAERLWETVGVRVPGLDDSAAVLRELARTKTAPAPHGTLIAIYQHLAGLVREAKQSAPRALASLPLWTDQGWRPSRSVYAVLDVPLERALAKQGLPVWRPPCRPEKLRDLLFALDVQIVEGSAAEPIAPDAAALVRGSEFLDDFWAAVDHFNDRLVERDYELHSQLGVGWQELRDAEIAMTADLKQRVPLPGRKAVTVPSKAYFLHDPLTLCVQSEQALGAADAAGNAIAALFESAEGRDYLELAWESAWSAALNGEQAVGIEVAPAEEKGDPLAEWQNDPRRPTKRGTMQRNSLKPKAKGAGSKAPDTKSNPTELATLESILARLPDVQYSNGGNTNGTNGSNCKPRKRPTVKLRPPKPNGGPPPKRAPRAGKAYDNYDVQLRGLEVLYDRMWEWFKLDLNDQHKVTLVGSDAVDEFAGFWVELKAHGGEPPDSETLTPTEAKRAYEEGIRYLLAIVSGLEEGATPDVRIFADPLNTLDFSFDRSVRVSGIRSHAGLRKISLPRAGKGARKK